MAALNWDADGERLFETGVDRGALYIMNSDSSYGTGEAWNGLTGVTESPEGADANDIYADNIKYLSLISKEDWKCTIKAYTYPEVFNACMGNVKASGIKAFIGQQSRKKFAFSWRSLIGNDAVGDKFAYKLHLAWGLSAAPSEMDHATQNDSPEAQEFSWEVSSIPPQTSEKIYLDGGRTKEMAIQPCAHVFITSKIIIPGQDPIPNPLCSAVEDKLYGKTNGTPTMPSLTDLIKFCKTGTWPVHP